MHTTSRAVPANKQRAAAITNRKERLFLTEFCRVNRSCRIEPRVVRPDHKTRERQSGGSRKMGRPQIEIFNGQLLCGVDEFGQLMNLRPRFNARQLAKG
ncbi:hypothetical protein ACLOJK_007831 [Asimina triloba]